HSARQELRLSRGEGIAEQVAILIDAGFNEAAKRADLDETWPTAPFIVGSTPCVPTSPYPSYCVDAMGRRPFQGLQEAIPIRVAYRLSDTDAIGTSYGWIVTDLNWNPARVVRIAPNRAWCEPATTSGTGPCAFGG
ncbi:MAG TPA: hypothetical protein VK191_08285, partial [Symbiobacteriaceae bacterium]|nr:hypothetical protein [Symbiobacteriaceae bacterium]